MNPSITLGRVAGVRIGINWSWIIVFTLIVWTLASAVFPSQDPNLGRPTYVAMALVAAVLFFSSLLLHELGHAVQARRDGVEIEGITLWLFGGVARFKGAFPSAGAELRIALAGPAVSALLGLLFVGIAAAGGLGTEVDGVAAWLGYINIALLAFNMLPALPLDGGRVLRSLLWLRSGDFGRATRIAADVGRGFGYLMVGLGLLLLIVQGLWSGVWLAFIGWFLLQAAAAEGRYGLLHDALGDLRVRDLMIRQPTTVSAHASLGEFMDTVAHVHHYTTYPVIDDGHVVGLLPFAAVARVPRASWETTRVLDCMLPLDAVQTFRADEPLLDAVTQMGGGTLDRALIFDEEHVVGLLSITDVGRLLSRDPSRSRPRRAMTWLSLIWKNLLRRPARTLFTAVGVGLGVGLIVALLAITNGVHRTAGDLMHVGRADFGLYQSDVSDFTRSLLPESLAAKVALDPGVAAVAKVKLLVDGGTLVFGLDPHEFAYRRFVVVAGARGAAMAGDHSGKHLGEIVRDRGPPVQGRRHLPLRRPLRGPRDRVAAAHGRVAREEAAARSRRSA